MSNLDKAYEMILRHISRDCESCYSTLGPCSACEDDATDAARALADAGLLAPDLPEPRINIGGWQEWGHKHGNCVTLHNGMVTVEIPDDISRDLSPGEARELAAWLNAAADYAEGKQ